MACRAQPYQAVSYVCNAEAVQCCAIESNCRHEEFTASWRNRAETDQGRGISRPVRDSNQYQAPSAAVTNNINICGNWNTVYVQAETEGRSGTDSNPGAPVTTNNINIYGNQNTVLVQVNYNANGTDEQSESFEVNKPQFHVITSVTGVDFGYKGIKRIYKAEKDVDPQHNLVTYTQTESTAQTLAHGFTLGLSSQRATLVFILIDNVGLFQQLADNLPPQIRLQDVETILRKLGPQFECARDKVRKDRFSLYLFAIKKTGQKFSEDCFQTWIRVSYWATHLPDSAADDIKGLSSMLTSPNMLLENGVKASLLLLGTLG